VGFNGSCFTVAEWIFRACCGTISPEWVAQVGAVDSYHRNKKQKTNCKSQINSKTPIQTSKLQNFKTSELLNP